jgi:hypothetical protein
MSDVSHLCGWRRDPQEVQKVLSTLPQPHFMGVEGGGWDGKSSVPLWRMCIKVTGGNLPAQKQDRGTCVSRGWSRGADYLQCVQIACGKPEEYYPISHAAVYGMAKEVGNDLSNKDGAVGAWAAKAVNEYGLVRNIDVNDSDTDDALAVKWGAKGVPQDVKDKMRGNLVKTVSLVKSVEAAADLLANGYLVPVCSDQGFTMTRDKDGFCKPRGSWNHCMLFSGVIVLPSGRKGLLCEQSWGQNTPDGPVVLGDAPDNSFGVDWDVADSMLKQEDSFGMSDEIGYPSRKLNWII